MSPEVNQAITTARAQMNRLEGAIANIKKKKISWAENITQNYQNLAELFEEYVVDWNYLDTIGAQNLIVKVREFFLSEESVEFDRKFKPIQASLNSTFAEIQSTLKHFISMHKGDFEGIRKLLAGKKANERDDLTALSILVNEYISDSQSFLSVISELLKEVQKHARRRNDEIIVLRARTLAAHLWNDPAFSQRIASPFDKIVEGEFGGGDGITILIDFFEERIFPHARARLQSS